MRLKESLSGFGITRVANVTGLDRLGLPVYMAIRPLSRSLAVSQGKGLSVDAAWVSGVMEAIELWHAETPGLDLVFATEAELKRAGRVLSMDRVDMRPGSLFCSNYRMLWTAGVELVASHPIYVPYGLVHVNAVLPFPSGDECFHVTSNGLASGIVKEDAIVHALCEVVERDAIARWQDALERERECSWIDLDGIEHGFLRDLLDYCDQLNFDVIASYAPSQTGLPVIVCVLLDREESSETLKAASMGFGCHLRRDVAFVRAFTEAAQSRLTLIAGSRDDLDRVDYESRRRHREGIAVYRRLVCKPKSLSYADVPDHSATPWDQQVARLVEMLSGAGCNEVAIVELSEQGRNIFVVRAIVPGMRGPDHAH